MGSTSLIKKIMHRVTEQQGDIDGLLSQPISTVMRSDPFIFPTNVKLNQAWKDFSTNHRQLGIVVDEFGSMTGIITPADIIARLVGHIPDESSSKKQNIVKLQGSQWEISGSTRIADLELSLNFPFPKDTGIITIGGLIFNLIGRVPEVGDVVKLDNSRLQILEIEELRVRKVLFQIMAVDENENWELSDKDSPAGQLVEAEAES
jgi:CBS domain containing-hemolysin-like protein